MSSCNTKVFYKLFTKTSEGLVSYMDFSTFAVNYTNPRARATTPARREYGWILPPEGWGPFAAFENCRRIRDFLGILYPAAPGVLKHLDTYLEVWAIEAEVDSDAEGVFAPAPDGTTFVRKGLPSGTVLVKRFRFLSHVKDFFKTETVK